MHKPYVLAHNIWQSQITLKNNSSSYTSNSPVGISVFITSFDIIN